MLCQYYGSMDENEQKPKRISVTYGGGVTAGKILVQAGDDGKFDEAGDNAVIVSGVAVSTGVDTTVGEMQVLNGNQLWKMQYTGTYNVNKIGSKVSINASQVVDLDDAGNDLLIFREYLDATYGVFQFIPACLTHTGGAEV